MLLFRGEKRIKGILLEFVLVNDVVVKWHENGRRSPVPPVRPGS